MSIITPRDLPGELTNITNGDTLIEVFNPITGANEKLKIRLVALLAGSVHTFLTYKDRTSENLLPYAFDNTVSKTGTYANLYTEVGDIFETQHIDSGDPSPGGTLFYPTPIPGKYGRTGVPDSSEINSTSDIDGTNITLTESDYTSLKRSRVGTHGVPVVLKLVSGVLPSPMNENQTYYLNFANDSLFIVFIYTTENNAIGNISKISLTDAVGTFRFTQEGIAIMDSIEEHGHSMLYTRDGSGFGGSARNLFNLTAPNDTTITNVVNANVTNESRGTTFYKYNYIKY